MSNSSGASLTAAPLHGPVSHFALSRTGLQLPRKLLFETWLQVGRHLSGVASSSAWCLGDWLVYGEATFSGRYRAAIEQTSLDYQTLRNYAWVTRRFAPSRRRDGLSFGHHAEVAALTQPEQDFWLRKAQQQGWSRNQIRREVRASLRERGCCQLGAEAAEPGGTEKRSDAHREVTLHLTVTPEQYSLCEQAAYRSGLSTGSWAVLALDQAARHSVGTG